MSDARGVFRHGVASGDPLRDRVIIWTRVTARDAPHTEVEWMVARDPALTDIVASGTAEAAEAADHTVKVDVGGLAPGSTYFYGFTALGEDSPTARTKTLPAGDRLRIAVCACARYMAGYFNAYGRIADRDELDFVLHLGDYIYEYGNDEKGPRGKLVREMQPRHETVTLADYRARYAHYRRDPDLVRLHHRHAIVATVDDHEFCNDAWRDGAGKHDPEKDGDWSVRKAAALQAWHEWMPVRPVGRDNPLRIYRSFEVGDLAHLILLDGRTERDEQTSDAERMDDPDRTILGAEQFEWLLSEIDRSRAKWRLIANGVMVGQVSSEFMPEELGHPLSDLGVLTKREHGPEPDQWDGYTAERDRFLHALLERGSGNNVLLSGDVHSSWAVDVHRDHRQRDVDPVAVEFVSTSVTSENLDEHMGTAPRTESLEVERRVIAENPHIHWAELDSHGYIVLDVAPHRVQADWYFVADVLRRTDEERYGDGWQVLDGERRLRHAEHPSE